MSDIKKTTLGDVITAARKACGLTQKQLSLRMDFTQGAISLVGSGGRTFTPHFAEELAAAVGGTKLIWLQIEDDISNGTDKTPEEFLSETLRLTPTEDMKGSNFTAMSRLVNEQIYDLFWTKRNGVTYGIEDFDPRRIKLTSYDTRIGYLGTKEGGDNKLIFEPLKIPKAKALRIRTRECFDLPEWMEAEIHAPSTIAKKSLNILNGPIIDPGFNGHLTVTVSNETEQDVFISPDEPFLTIRFSVLGKMPMPEDNFRSTNNLDELTDDMVFGSRKTSPSAGDKS